MQKEITVSTLRNNPTMSNIPITFSDGQEFNLDNVLPDLLGYQIVHVLTGRILPGTTRTELYTKAAAIKKMNKVASMFTVMHTQLDIWEYTLSPMYEGEIKEYVLITDLNDKYL
jgi:hypothetical protein